MTEEKKTFGHKLAVPLSEAELKAKNAALVECDIEIRDIKAKKALAVAEFNATLKDKGKVQEGLLGIIKAEKEFIEIQCYEEADDRRGMMLTRRSDNGEIVDERALTQQELDDLAQGKLFDGKSAEGDGGAENAEQGADAGPGDGDGDEEDDDDDGEADPDLQSTLDAYEAQQGQEVASAAAPEGSGEAVGADTDDEKPSEPKRGRGRRVH